MDIEYEVEIRSFISESDYDRLKLFFDSDAKLQSISNQETYYLQANYDLRIQNDDHYAKIWLKKGSMHDSQREEIEIIFNRADFNKMYQLFSLLNHDIKIKWLRKRLEYDWAGIKVCLDNTKGYGYIIELEQKTIYEHECGIIYNTLEHRLKSLNINISSREEFDIHYLDYQKNWKKYLEME